MDTAAGPRTRRALQPPCPGVAARLSGWHLVRWTVRPSPCLVCRQSPSPCEASRRSGLAGVCRGPPRWAPAAWGSFSVSRSVRPGAIRSLGWCQPQWPCGRSLLRGHLCTAAFTVPSSRRCGTAAPYQGGSQIFGGEHPSCGRPISCCPSPRAAPPSGCGASPSRAATSTSTDNESIGVNRFTQGWGFGWGTDRGLMHTAGF